MFEFHSRVSGSSKTLQVLQASGCAKELCSTSRVPALIQRAILPLFFSFFHPLQKERVREFVRANVCYHPVARGLKFYKGDTQSKQHEI